MRKLLTAGMAMALMGALGGGAFAADTAKAPTNKSTAASKSAAKKPAVHSLSGSIESYDASSHALTLKTAKASTTFDVGADTKVWAGSKSVAADELSTDTGRKATVKYSEEDGKKAAKSVHVAAAATAAKAHPAAKPSK